MSSKSSVNMLRTRRKDNNVKPNRRNFRSGRLDRKSSRGMIYENEELRLKTININAEIERGQYDIKKLKRENELLKKEIWCLRDEYEKLDKLLKEKEIEFSSSSTTSDSESCTSCLDESDDFENDGCAHDVQRPNANSLNRTFEALSVVPEESTENSDRTSILNEQLPLDDEDVIQADQSYPRYDNAPTLRLNAPVQNASKNFFSNERLESKPSFQNDQTNDRQDYASEKIVTTDATSFYQNIVLVPKQKIYPESETMTKAGTDVMVKMDNRNFRQTVDQEPNGGDDVYIDQFADDFPRYCSNFGTNSHSTFSNGGNLEELLNDIETISQDILAISNTSQNENYVTGRRCKSDINPQYNQDGSKIEKPFKSELNVTLMPQPMALIGLEKYKDIQRSMNTTPSKSMENLSNDGLQIFNISDNQLSDTKEFPQFQRSNTNLSDFSPINHTPLSNKSELPTPKVLPPSTFPAFLSNLKDNYINGEYFARYNPDNFQPPDKGKNDLQANEASQKESLQRHLVKQPSIDVPSSENDENSKIRNEIQTQNKENAQNASEILKSEQKQKVGLRKKVSIHFRGKKDKIKSLEVPNSPNKKHSPIRDKKIPEIKIEENKTDKLKFNHQKTSSRDSNKTTSESDTKNNQESKKNEPDNKRQQKNLSVSPDRKKTDRKCKKHKKDRAKMRRATVTSLESRDNRARSHSVNTERSNTYGGSHFLYDEYGMNSERESMSSCDTFKTRQMNFTNISIGGKVPWCGCWGNGCI